MPIDRAKAEQMSLEELMALRDQLKSERQTQQPQVQAPQRPNMMNQLGRALLLGGRAYTTGQVPEEALTGGGATAEPDWYTKQQIEQEQKLALEKDKARIAAEQEATAIQNLPEGDWTTDTVKIGSRTYKRQPSEAELEAEAKQLAKKELIKGEAMTERGRSKLRRQSAVDFEVAKNKLRTTAAAFKAMAGKAGGMGRMSGIFGGKLAGAVGANPYTKAYEGQLVEAAAALAKLASPSARVGKDIIAEFKSTLPDVLSTEGEFLSQIRFSLHNAFATALANREEEYTPELREEVDRMVDEIMNVPAMSVEDMERAVSGKSIGGSSLREFRSEAEAEAAGLTPGTEIIINGRRAIWE